MDSSKIFDTVLLIYAFGMVPAAFLVLLCQTDEFKAHLRVLRNCFRINRPKPQAKPPEHPMNS